MRVKRTRINSAHSPHVYVFNAHTSEAEYLPTRPPSDLKTGDRLRSKRGTAAGVCKVRGRERYIYCHTVVVVVVL